MDLSKTAYVILGMLKLGRRTGYEIKRLVDVSTRFFWAASYGQIYPELAHLEELGLVEGERDPSDPRRRKAYELTPSGEEALREWLTSPVPLHLELRHEGCLKLFFSDALEPEEQIELLRRISAEHERVAERLREIEPRARALEEETGTRCPRVVLEWGLDYEGFFVEWCRRVERELAGDAARAGG